MNSGCFKEGRKNPRWRPGVLLSKDGYRLVRVGPEHPLADTRGYAFEHVLALAATGRMIGCGEVSHHLNGDRLDNRPENLTVKARREHSREHAEKRARDAFGRFQK